jgi:DNA-binding NtrC family response regulator
MGLALREAREVFEREYLVAQISRFGGNISRTAEFVGMERSASRPRAARAATARSCCSKATADSCSTSRSSRR